MSWFETGFYPNFRPTRGLFQGLVRQLYIYIYKRTLLSVFKFIGVKGFNIRFVLIYCIQLYDYYYNLCFEIYAYF